MLYHSQSDVTSFLHYPKNKQLKSKYTRELDYAFRELIFVGIDFREFGEIFWVSRKLVPVKIPRKLSILEFYKI